MPELLERLRGGLIVSVQPVRGGPLDRAEFVRAMGEAALSSGAVGLRVESFRDITVMRKATDRPIIALIKRELADSPVRITPRIEEIPALAVLGVEIIAVDATARQRPVPVPAMLEAIHAAGCLAMADVSNLEEGRAAAAAGFDILGSTLAGYTSGGADPTEPDLELVTALKSLGRFTIAEGNLHTPKLARAAREAGADAVCVGTAITRLEHVTQWFAAAVSATPAPAAAPQVARDVRRNGQRRKASEEVREEP